MAAEVLLNFSESIFRSVALRRHVLAAAAEIRTCRRFPAVKRNALASQRSAPAAVWSRYRSQAGTNTPNKSLAASHSRLSPPGLNGRPAEYSRTWLIFDLIA